MSPLLSIILPSIRTENLESIYKSIFSSFDRTFELIICGPYTLPTVLQQSKNVKFVRDFGSPVRCSQIAAILAEGKYIMHSADDALFLPNALNKNIDLLESMGDDLKNVVVAKYFEGEGWGNDKPLQPDSYFQIGGSTWTKSNFIPDKWWLFNVAIMHKLWFETLGGWDCENFKATFYSHTDLAIRSQYCGSNIKMSEFPLLNCSHNQPDHGIIESVQTNIDKNSYFKKYNNQNWGMIEQLIDINNWKNSEIVWERFK